MVTDITEKIHDAGVTADSEHTKLTKRKIILDEF